MCEILNAVSTVADDKDVLMIKTLKTAKVHQEKLSTAKIVLGLNSQDFDALPRITLCTVSCLQSPEKIKKRYHCKFQDRQHSAKVTECCPVCRESSEFYRESSCKRLQSCIPKKAYFTTFHF